MTLAALSEFRLESVTSGLAHLIHGKDDRWNSGSRRICLSDERQDRDVAVRRAPHELYVISRYGVEDKVPRSAPELLAVPQLLAALRDPRYPR